jgi:hypothetical protein
MIKGYKIIDYIVYPFNILVSFNMTEKELKDILKHILPNDEKLDIEKLEFHEGTTVMFSTGQTVMNINNIDYRTISHEIFHAVVMLMNRVDINLTDDSEEAFAYLIGYLTEEIFKFKKELENKLYLNNNENSKI